VSTRRYRCCAQRNAVWRRVPPARLGGAEGPQWVIPKPAGKRGPTGDPRNTKLELAGRAPGCQLGAYGYGYGYGRAWHVYVVYMGQREGEGCAGVSRLDPGHAQKCKEGLLQPGTVRAVSF